MKKASLEADVIVKSEIDKQKKVIEAEAIAEETRRKARGEADAIYAKMEAEGRGMLEILNKQAEGFTAMVKAANNDANAAIRLLIADKLETLVGIQVEAIKNLKFDKITVWDGGSGKDGTSQTANFASNLMRAIPPMQDLFQMAGMELPNYLGKDIQSDAEVKKDEVEVKKRSKRRKIKVIRYT